jgi:hypothetical protein
MASSSLSTSGHGSCDDVSETSDYQRSTPSPRDDDLDDLFVVQRPPQSKAGTKFNVSQWTAYVFGQEYQGDQMSL